MLHIYQDTIIYVLCPAHIVTGGIEAVHQLVDSLRRIGHQAKIVTMPIVANPVLLQYRNYDVEFATSIEDKKHNILITTEVNPRALDAHTSIQKALWWLSVDNHEKLKDRFDFFDVRNQAVTHLAQSAYAEAFLKERNVARVHPLSDYLHAEYLRPIRRKKRDLVLYTPVKGAEQYVNRLMDADPSIQWLPLKGMIRKMHAECLRLGKVYVDFGSHPGKDRQPREAAVNGCCVVVGLRGSACFEDDMPIPANYKFAVERLDVNAILSTIRSCLLDYENRIGDFEPYRNMILHEQTRFAHEVAAVFGIKRWSKKSHKLIAFGNTINFIRQNKALTVARGLANEILPLAITNTARSAYRNLYATILKIRSK
ncbi:MAG: hypothetical protein ACK40D_08885 [Cyanobacteriota bacterium]|jgi:hypothetical protein